MSFFIYTSFAEYLVDAEFWVYFIIGGLIFVIVSVLYGLGLYTIAKREGYAHRWMAFVPFLNTYYTGVCSQKNRCISLSPKTVAMIAAIIEVIVFAGYALWYIADVILSYGGWITSYTDGIFIYPYLTTNANGLSAPDWAAWCFTYLYENNILYYAYLVFVVLEIMIFSAFFQTFACRRYTFFSITGAICSFIFPIYGILVYAVRNNKGMNYRDFKRREQERQYRAYQQYYRQNGQNPYDTNPYSHHGGGYPPPPNNGYNNTDNSQNNTNNNSADDPFSEFGNSNGSSDDPFDDGSN